MEKDIKILMVDDEEQFRETTAKILKKKGYITTMAESGEEAIEIMEATPHDVVILDIKMKGIDGHEALVKIKKRRPECKVIMLTGHGSIDSAKLSLSEGADDYLNKPCDIDLLAQKINTLYFGQREISAKKEKKARDLMIRVDDYSQVNIKATIADAITILIKSYNGYVASSRLISTVHRSMLVYNDSDILMGILSIRNLREALRPSYLTAAKPSMADSMTYSPIFWSGLFTSQLKNLAKKQVRDIMNESLVTVDGETNLMEVAETMYRFQTRRVVVMDDTKVVGIIREQELFFEIANIIREQID